MICEVVNAYVVQAAGAAGPMPSVRSVGSSGQVNSLGSVATTGKPAGTAVNDIILIETEITPGSGFTDLTSFGFTEHPNSPQSGTNSVLQLWWRRADGSEPASWDIPRVSDHTIADAIAVQDCITSGSPFDASVGDNTDSGTSQTIPGLTTTGANRLVMDFISTGADTGTGVFTSFTNGDLSSVTRRVNHGYSGSSGGQLGAADGGKAAAGSVGATTVAISNGADSAGGQIKTALLPT